MVGEEWVAEQLIPARSRRQAMDWSLVLASQDIGTTVTRTAEGCWVLLVEAGDYARAIEAIRLYRAENRPRGWTWRTSWRDREAEFHWGALMVCAVLSIVYQFTELAPAWKRLWVFDTRAALTGEWWRTFSATWLHADLAHLASNLTTGVILFGLAMGRFGAGCALLAAFLAGALGNVTGLLLHTRPYTGLGASGMVMGALGMLCCQHAALWRVNPATTKEFTRGVLAGGFLFVLLGMNPKADVLAHAGGFVSGAIFGAGLSFVPEPLLRQVRWGVLMWTFLLGLIGLVLWVSARHL